jgi:hypothetical protein
MEFVFIFVRADIKAEQQKAECGRSEYETDVEQHIGFFGPRFGKQRHKTVVK